MSSPRQVLDLTGGHLDIRVNPGDGEAFLVPLPTDLTAWAFSATGGLAVTVTSTAMTVRIPASVTTNLTRPVDYTITCQPTGGEPTTLLSGLVIPE